MRIAVASDGLEVASYFERSTNFNFFTIENGEITDYRNLPNIAWQKGSTAAVLQDLGIDVVIVGCISERSLAQLEDQSLTIFAGAVGDAKKSVEAYITDTFIACDEACVGYDDEEDSGQLLMQGNGA